jgi:hypothetical protein
MHAHAAQMLRHMRATAAIVAANLNRSALLSNVVVHR